MLPGSVLWKHQMHTFVLSAMFYKLTLDDDAAWNKRLFCFSFCPIIVPEDIGVLSG